MDQASRRLIFFGVGLLILMCGFNKIKMQTSLYKTDTQTPANSKIHFIISYK